MENYYVKCVRDIKDSKLFTKGEIYLVSEKGLHANDAMIFHAYKLDINGGENTIEAINRWFGKCREGYQFELATANEKVTKEEAEDIVTLNWTKARCRNVAEFLELYFFDNIRDDVDMDSLWYLHDLLHAIEELNEAGKGI